METMAEYLAELVKAGLEDRKAASLPEGVSVREIVKISEENHMDYLLLGALLKTDGLSEEEKELLREKVLGSMLFTGMQLQELKKLEERMEQAKIPCQPMKGARMKFYYPSPIFCTDNAAMIGVAAYYEFKKGTRHGWDLNAVPNLRLGER